LCHTSAIKPPQNSTQNGTLTHHHRRCLPNPNPNQRHSNNNLPLNSQNTYLYCPSVIVPLKVPSPTSVGGERATPFACYK